MSLAIYIAAFVTLAAGFVLLERALTRRRQPVLRSDGSADLLHVVLSNSAPAAAVQVVGYAALAELSSGSSFELMAEQPLYLQVIVILVLTDLSFYLVHCALHRVPALWRLHRMHHTPSQMDWLSGYRKHALETLLHSSVTFVPVALLGFAPTAWLVFGIIGIFFSGFTHLNISTEMRWLESLVVTPRYHAWHHSAAVDQQRYNLAGKLTFLDRIFGTRRCDTRQAWPESLGLDHIAPTTWWPMHVRGPDGDEGISQ